GESGGDGQDLELIAGYALQVRPGRNERYGLGEGLVGQAAREKRTLVVRNVPPDYATVVSGTGETSARHILVVPLLVESRVNGVVELASLAEFTPLQQQYLEQSMAVLGVAVEAAQSRDALSQALQHSQQLSEELQAQQEELRATNEELEAQTRALSASEQKLRGQQEELAVTNEELAEKTRLAERRNEDLEEARVVLEEKAKELAQASRYKSQFLANMSHELRTPLNSLLLLAQSLSDNRQGNLTDDQLEAVRVIHASGHDLLNLINDILDLAKIEAGRTELILEPLLLVDAAARLRASFDPLAQKKGLVFTLVVAPDAPAQIVTDGKRFEQVVRNLLSNAFKFTEAGDVTVTFSRPAAETDLAALGLPPEQCLAVSVHDTGIGIASEQQKLIFEAFRQADGGITRRYGGSGLGLAISRELARLLGGEIRLQSELGKGSTFTFLVPLEHPASRVRQPAPVSEPEAEVPSPPVAESGPPPEPDEGYVRRVLVIEDRPADRKAIVELIAEKDITVEEAGTGMEAIEALRRRRFDCVVLDMTLPDISGFEVLQRLRADNVRLPPVVVYTCRDLTREETLMLREHTDAIVLKGVRSTERLLDEVSLFLHQLVSRMPEHKRQILSRIHDSDQQLRDRKVLVVDDDMRTVFALARLLTGHGMRPIKAESGERALALLDEQPDIDLALVDIMMPSMDGFETIRKIRAQERFQKLPVIVLTAKAMKGDREQCLACGASDYLAKPVDQHRLLSMLRVWLYR
ncbi:MAG: response regulator, partial [Deltaproteobacteria bacterium]|nr:response regulator [Deltaproteobacteria bacterium]